MTINLTNNNYFKTVLIYCVMLILKINQKIVIVKMDQKILIYYHMKFIKKKNLNNNDIYIY